ncbi:MAG: PIG-L deacetylase family protein, partial [Anaerolineae bacterium]
ETLGIGATLTKYAAEGVATYLVCATRGERGWYESEGPNPGPQAVGKLREAELRCAAEHLGLRDVNILGYIDGEVDQAAPDAIISQITAQIRRIRPHVVITFPPDGSYGHPDHIALSQFTAAALVCAADRSYSAGQGLAAHRVSKFYYVVDSEEVVQLAKDAFGGISIEVDGATRNHMGWPAWEITTHIDARVYIPTVREAVLCHKSQLPGYGPLAEASDQDMAAWFGHGDFYRVFSMVNRGRQVETDLFEGLR